MNCVSRSTTGEQLLFIDAPHFCCGIVLVDDRVIRAAPIVRYLVGWHRHHVQRYGRARGWRLETVTSTGGQDGSVRGT